MFACSLARFPTPKYGVYRSLNYKSYRLRHIVLFSQ